MRELLRYPLVLAALVCVLWSRPALASTITPTSVGGFGSFAFSGSFEADNDVALLSITVPGPTLLTASTSSYANGGFDPVLSLYGPTGDLLTFNDDGDPSTFDSLISLQLLFAGTYTLAITQAINYPHLTLADGFDFSGAGNENFTQFYATVDTNCSQFIEFDGSCNDSTFAGGLNLTAAETPAVPEPASLTLLATGLGAWMARRRTANGARRR